MKSRQLLSIVLSLIMVFGVSAGSAYAASHEMDDSVEQDSYDDDRYDKDEVHDYDDKLEDKLDRWCEMTDEEKDKVIAEHDKSPEKVAELDRYCTLDEKERDAYVDAHEDEYRKYDKGQMMDSYCDMTYEEKRAFVAEHDKTADHVKQMTKYCTLGEDDRMKFIKEQYKDYMKDSMRTADEMQEKLEEYCGMSETDRTAYIAEHEKTAEKAAKMDSYCILDNNAKEDFIEEHLDEYRAYKKGMMTDKKHMDYDAMCAMSEADLAAKITDVTKLEKITEWCNMTPEEREEYKMKHPDVMKDKMMDKKRMDYPDSMKEKMHDKCTGDDCPMMDGPPHDFDRMSEMGKDNMSGVAKEKLQAKSMKFSDKSDRLKAMIMTKYDITDERMDEIKMKYREKHGDVTDKQKSDLKTNYKKHMSHQMANMSDERRSMIHDRIAEMKAFKADLRENSAEMTDKQKQELREEFIEKAQDMHLAWISPRVQMTAGVDAGEVECREGFSLVFKESNGVAMCLKADSALKMIDRGIVVPSI